VARAPVFSDSGTTAQVQWTTNIPSTGTVYYGLSAGALGSTKADSALGTKHSVTLNGLKKRTVYYYVIKAQAQNAVAASNVASFETK
jgi:hypothetical protein